MIPNEEPEILLEPEDEEDENQILIDHERARSKDPLTPYLDSFVRRILEKDPDGKGTPVYVTWELVNAGLSLELQGFMKQSGTRCFHVIPERWTELLGRRPNQS